MSDGGLRPYPTCLFIVLSFYRFIALSLYRFIEKPIEAVGIRLCEPMPTYGAFRVICQYRSLSK